jgi:ParB family chromosome partitioning protein
MLAPNQKQKPKRDINTIRVIKDIRIFSNTIKQAIDLMNQSGIKATSEKNENDDYIEYIVRIPK